MSDLRFYDADPDEQVAITLFHGWGYNFYKLENQLRADDLMVRAKIGGMLAAARASVEAAEAEYRRAFLPPPSREKPRQDAAALAAASSLEAVAHEIGALEGQVRALPVPENDRMTQRFRDEAETLGRLLAADRALVAGAEHLRAGLARATSASLLENLASLRTRLAALQAEIEARRDILR